MHGGFARRSDPFRYLYRDSDVESATDGWDDTTAYGVDHVVDDPSMGWSRFVHGFRAFTRDPGLTFLRATQQVHRTRSHPRHRRHRAPCSTGLTPSLPALTVAERGDS